MLRNYLKIAWRSISRYKAYSIINISGLALGIASCLVIFLIVRYELGYDHFHRKADRTYRVTLHALDYNPSVSMAVAPALRNDFPELEQVSQVWYQSSGLVKVGPIAYNEKGYAYADEYFTHIFDYPWLAGNPRTALSNPNAVVLTESAAKKYFGDKDAMGQLINLDNQYDLKVTGVMKDLPGNSHLNFLFLVSFETVKKDIPGLFKNFYAIAGGTTYFVIPEKASIQQIHRRIPAFIEKNWGGKIAKEADLVLQPLTDIHFDKRYIDNSSGTTTSRENYWALSAVALLILLIACINFINMATAQALHRAKEVGVRKVLGSSRAQLIWQFMGETGVMVLLALILGILLTLFFLPKAALWLNLRIGVAELTQPAILILSALVTIGVILLAGLYPAFVQSSFRPLNSMKGNAGIAFRGLTLRKALVVVQFAISQILIIGTLVVAYQMDFFRNRDLGFNKEAVVVFRVPDRDKLDVLKQGLSTDPGVKDLSFASAAPAYNSGFAPLISPELGYTKDQVTEMKSIDEHFLDFFSIKTLAGTSISKKNENDTPRRVMVNETLIRQLGMNDPRQAIGKRIVAGGQQAVIDGVVEDFQSESKHKKRRPCVLYYRERNFFMASVRLQPKAARQSIARIEKLWTGLFPKDLFEIEFLDEHIAAMYSQEEKEYTAFKLFSFIAILIGCLGLYGLVAFAAARRTKEVGIRKVLGASLPNIVFLFAREFILLIAIAFLIAAPVAYLTMHNWLESFAYQIHIGGGIFLLAIGVSFLIAGVTIAVQAVRAGLANPVTALKSE